WKGWAILLRQKQKKLIMLPSETMIWQPEFTDKILSRKPGAVQTALCHTASVEVTRLLNLITPTHYRSNMPTMGQP
ncbi:hypothetical protein, partial [Escherichia coli]|uniref:hypothetical protein n=1 Tax=Escherichia coli TaxID=562 RepID=UPI003C1AF50F